MKVALLVLTTLFSASVLATEQTVAVLKATAQELDTLVSQNRIVYREAVKPGFKPDRKAVPPVSLKKIAPVVAAKLNLPQNQVVSLLKNDREKLSDVVLARAIEQSNGKPWKELLAQHDPDELLRQVEERQLTAKVKSTMDELYAEVSFAALDSMGSSTAKGASPGASVGTNSSQSK